MSAISASTPRAAPNIGEDFVGEATGAWACAYDAWANYIDRLMHAGGPIAVFEAGAQLWEDSFQIGGRAAMARLQAAGAVTPLLNDA